MLVRLYPRVPVGHSDRRIASLLGIQGLRSEQKQDTGQHWPLSAPAVKTSLESCGLSLFALTNVVHCSL